jgi:serine/threonine protein kinase
MLKRHVSKEEYRQQIKNFSSSKHSESIIKFHGSYTHGNDFNILLEYADKGTLEEYFQRQTPPNRSGDIIKFWDGLFQLIKAVKTIHSFSGFVTNPAELGSLTNLSRGHQDITPAGILVLSYGAELAFNWQFKFADFGTSHTASKSASGGDTVVDEDRGPETYGLLFGAQSA